ncbi:MAG: hypothetical protein V1745_03695 [Patescibacteria group bacterium]
MYGLTPEEVPAGLSQHYLQRMRLVMTSLRRRVFAEKVDNKEMNSVLGTREREDQGPRVFLKDFMSYVQAWARDPSGRNVLRRGDMKTYGRILAAKGVDPKRWYKGSEAMFADVVSREMVPVSVRMQRSVAEFAGWFRTFVENEIHGGDACLQEVANRIAAASPTVEDIMLTVGSDESKLRNALTVAVARGSRKDALKGDEAVGFYHLQRLQRSFSPRPSGGGGTFTIRLASKNPFTVLDIGNDGGCCIGVYIDSDSDAFHGAVGQIQMPRFLVDPATQFVEVMRGNRRCGMALLFAAEDVDERPVIVVNSIELNETLADVADPVVDAVLAWVQSFAKAAGFAYVVMGSHDHNTGMTHGERSVMTSSKVSTCWKDLSWRVKPRSTASLRRPADDVSKEYYLFGGRLRERGRRPIHRRYPARRPVRREGPHPLRRDARHLRGRRRPGGIPEGGDPHPGPSVRRPLPDE